MSSLTDLRKRYAECKKHLRTHPATVAEVLLAYQELLTGAGILIQRCYGIDEGGRFVRSCGQLQRAINLKAEIVTSGVRTLRKAGQRAHRARQKSRGGSHRKPVRPASKTNTVQSRG